MKKRILSLLLVLVMVLSLVPTVAFAGSPTGTKLEAPGELTSGDYFLNQNITGNITVPSGVTATLDLNGCTITGRIDTSGNLTIKDTSDKGEGTVNNTAGYGSSNKAAVVQNGGSLTIESGNFTGEKGTATTAPYAVYAYGTVSIKGGNFGAYGVSVSSGSITGGTFNKDVTDYIASGYVCLQEGTAYRVVQLNADTAAAEVIPAGQEAGTLYADLKAAFKAAQTGATIKVLNNTSVSTQVAPNAGTYTLDLNGKTVSCTSYLVYISSKEATVTVTDTSTEKNGTVNCTGSAGPFYVYGSSTKNAKLIIDAGNFNSTTYCVTTGASYGTSFVTINGGNFYADNNSYTVSAVQANGGTIEINGGTFNVSNGSEQSAPIKDYSNQTTLNIKGGYFGVGPAGSISDSNGKLTVNITGNTENGKGAYFAEGTNVEKFLNEGNWYLADNEDAGTKADYPYQVKYSDTLYTLAYDVNGATGAAPASKRYAPNKQVAVKDAPEGMTNGGKFFDGWNTKADGSGTAYRPLDEITLTESVTLFAQWADKNYIAQVDDAKYDSLADAFAAANGKTVKILKDFTVPAYTTASYITVPQGNTVTLDLNGYTISTTATKASADSFITNNGALTITDTSAAKDGAIEYTATNPWWWTIPTIPAEATDEQVEQAVSDSYKNSYASNIISNHGSVTVEAGRLTNKSVNSSAGYAIDCYGDACVTVNGGTVEAYCASAIRMFNSTDKAVATVTGGTIGRVESFYDSDYATTNRSYFGLQFMGGNATANVSGGKILGRYGIGSTVGNKLPRNTYNISGGEFDGTFYATATNEDKTMYQVGGAIAPMQYTKDQYNISGGKFNDHGAGLELFGDVNISGGTFGNVKIYQRFFTLKDDPWENTVNVSGGDFTYLYILTTNSNPAKALEKISVTGGRFKYDTVAVYCDETTGNPIELGTESYTDGNVKTYKCIKCITGGKWGYDNYVNIHVHNTAYWLDALADGYVKVANTDDDWTTYWWTISKNQIVVDQESIAASTKTDTNGQALSEEAATSANETIGKMMDNKNVNLFTETGIYEATGDKRVSDGSYNITKVLEAIKEAAKDADKNLASNEIIDANAQTTGNDQITVKEENIREEDIEKQINVELESTKIEVIQEQGEASTITTTVNGATYDVKPTAKITIVTGTPGTGAVTKTVIHTVIPNDAITAPIKFRLPIDNTDAKTTAVYRSDDPENLKEEYLGIFEIQKDEDGNYVELASDHFSYFTYENLNVDETKRVAVKDTNGNTKGFDTLAAAIAAFGSSGDGGVENAQSIILLGDVEAGKTYATDITEGTTFDFGGKAVALDLNGYKLTGASENATNVTVSNSGDVNHQLKLAATGVYKNNVSAFVADGYDAKTTTVENDTVISTTETGVYSVVATVETTTERDADTDGVDVFADDTVTVKVIVNGARFVAADVTLSYDKDKFEMISSPTTDWSGDLAVGGIALGTMNGSSRFYNAKSGGGYYADGTVLGTFTFKAKAQSENVTADFKVDSKRVYVAGAWSQGWNTQGANQLASDKLTNTSARIILKNMSASVTPNNGLAYTAQNQALLQAGYTAKDNTTNAPITDATITYALLTKAEVEGTPLKDSGQNVLYYTTEGGTETSTTVTAWPAYENGKAPKTPADGDYTNNIPAPKNADDYVVFYKIEKPGYVTVSDKVNVSIAKRVTTINWTASDFVVKSAANAGTDKAGKDNAGNDIAEDWYKAYAETAAAMPNAEYDSAEINDTTNATAEQLTVTKKPSQSDDSLKAVGSYEVTVDLGPNYYITNPTCTLLIDGGLITGYDLQNADANNDSSITDADKAVWYDGAEHAVAQLVMNSTLVPTVDKTTIQYRLNGGEWQNTIPNVKEVGKYTLEMKITADSYYDFTDSVEFEIKNVTYKVEKTDYVTGWDLVLVYTNDAVPGFTYTIDGETPAAKNMYNVSDLGYEHGTVWNAAGTAVTTAGTHYTYVYAIVVFGDADITKVVPSNVASIPIDRTNTKNRCDVNNSNTVDINDLVAVQGTYNVSAEYLNDTQMSIVLRADVSGNKKVDTYDCSLVKLNSDSTN